MKTRKNKHKQNIEYQKRIEQKSKNKKNKITKKKQRKRNK